MKFWKPLFLTTLLMITCITALFYSACEKDVCDNVNCLNGGSCNLGKCRCPVGFEGTQCQAKTTDRFAGVYAGFTQCNNPQQTLDSVLITPGTKPNTVVVAWKSILPKLLYGYISNNQSTYSIVVTDNDSSATYARIYTITLQYDVNLSIHAYNVNYTSATDSSIDQCNFLGVKK